MDKIIGYKKIVKKILKEIIDMIPDEEGIDNQMITDDEHGHYLLYSVGWQQTYREYSAFVHIDIKPTGKIMLQHDGTNLKIALLLHEAGVPKQDIVLAFQAPIRRGLMPEFAQA